ncbi:MAG: camphor resistance protein CrcB [Rhodobacterales bacterium 32-66-7]|nr:MAG: camphor resistance protein CrcB [Rhodobacterales bacterium 12-65-15]OYX23421.1 MAG: camphor resistance protein CrcB [Rhodobacterales bacterium 32-66-7]
MSQTLTFVALGGALGSVLRYMGVAAIGAPIGTAVVNVVGCFAIGLGFVLLAGRDGWQLFLLTGLLGGFTTFSAFSLDALKLITAGQPLQAFAYVLGSVTLSLVAVAMGAALAKGFA